MSVKALQEFTRITRYARYNTAEERRETWFEQVNRVMTMHRDKLAHIPGIEEYLDKGESALKKKEVLGSQRVLQFGGRAILEKNTRLYNCSVSYVDRPRFFQEIIWVLLCGAGAGFSVQKHHIDKLPKITHRNAGNITHIIEDSIEGWADAIGILMTSYFVGHDNEFSNYTGKIVKFDFSKIRPAGALIKSSQSKAPGPEGLKNSISKIEELLDKRLINTNKPISLRPIDAYDIIMHESDAVLSGGVRRSATICIFSHDDDEMMSAKTGSWFIDNPQRGRSNNSAMIIRNEITKPEFDNLIDSVKQFGEPGFVFADDKEALYNPCVEIGMYAYDDEGNSGWSFCVSEDTELLTKTGKTTISESVGKDIEIWNGKEWKTVKPFHTGSNRKLYRVHLSDGSYLDCTDNHKWSVKDRFQKEYSKVETKDLMNFSKYTIHTPPPEVEFIDGVNEEYAYEYGFILGDGCCKRTDTESQVRIPRANLFNDDLNLPLRVRIINNYKNANGTDYTTVSFDDVDKEFGYKLKYKNGLPSEIFNWNRESLKAFIAGWIDADGSKASRGFRIYGTNNKLKDLQLLLTKLGIYSSLNIAQVEGSQTNLGIRKTDLYYIQVSDIADLYCNKFEMSQIDRKVNGKGLYQVIKSVEELSGLHETYCLEEPERHMCLFNNVMTYQCNLTEINVKKAKTKEQFLRMCDAAAILGTIQASYDDFDYLGPVTEKIVRREALLGVSMTGMMDNPEISFNPELQREGAELIKRVNEELAPKLSINPAARTTCIKPAGSTSAILGTASGIHPHHYKRYFRRVQVNKLEEPVQFFKLFNPDAVEESVWSNNNTDDVVTFLCEVPSGAKTKVDIDAIKLLEYVKLTQRNWVASGKNDKYCTQPWLSHNVSNTINVKDDEWDTVRDYIFENRNYFAGISLLPMSGDKDFNQAPFSAVYTPVELAKMYGEGQPMASGVIVRALEAYDDDLWDACAAALGYAEDLEVFTPGLSAKELASAKRAKNYSAKKEWLRQANQFAERYFDGDTKKMTYCLKDVYNWKKWCDLKRVYQDIPWEDFKELVDNTKVQDTVACGGQGCDI